MQKSPLTLFDGYSTSVSSNGDFCFEDIPPGSYTLVAEGGGFLPQEYGAAGPNQTGVPIELHAGHTRKDISITLAPKRVVCGKVTDEHGAPMPKVEIYAFAHLHGTSWLTLDDPDNMRTITDENGNYHLPDLPPGQYFLEAAMSTWFSPFETLTQTETETLANAEPVEVGADEGKGCQVNFLMRPRLGYMARRIRGTIADDPALAGKDLVLSFLEVNPTGATRPWPFDTSKPSRSFDLQIPLPGRYRLTLSNGRFPQNWAGPPPEFHVFASQDITITDQKDLNGITLQANPLASLTGHVTLENISPRASCPTGEKLHMSIQKDDDGQFWQMELNSDGSFTFPYVALGSYNVRLYPLLRGRTYIQSLLLDGHPVDARKIDLSTPGAHTLSVVLNGDPAVAAGHVTPDEPLKRYASESTHPKASVSGTVTHALPGSPPRVKLWSVRFNSDRSYEYSTSPAPDGTFHFENVDPGIYILLTQGPDYTVSEYGAAGPGLEGKSITLTRGQHLDGVKLLSSPSAPSASKPRLCGRVLDENGQPMSTVIVYPWLVSPTGGYLLSGVATDESGKYAFTDDLKSGSYFLWAEHSVFTPSGDSSTRKLTYFPSSPNLDGAQPIKVGLEPDLECKHNIQIQAPPSFHVRGTIPAPLPHSTGQVFQLSLIETNQAGAQRWDQINRAIPPGESFDFGNVRAGHYRLQLRGPFTPPKGTGVYSGPCGPPEPRLVSSQDFVVQDHDVSMTIDLNSQVSVAGQLTIEASPANWKGFQVAPPSDVSLTLGNRICSDSARLDPQGAFALEYMEPGKYAVKLDLRGPFYLKSIRLNGQLVEGNHITLTPGRPAKLDLIVSGAGAEVDLDVTPSAPPAETSRFDEPCQPRIAAGAHAFLIPDPISPDGSGVRTGANTQEGHLQFIGVPPGQYRVVAGENLNLLFAPSFLGEGGWNDPKVLRAVLAHGAPLTVAAGQALRLKIPSATAELQNVLAEHQQPITMADHCAASCGYDEFWTGREKSPAPDKSPTSNGTGTH